MQQRITRVYRVYGAMRSTGEDTSKLVEAASAEDAEREANRLGLMVSGVEIAGGLSNASLHPPPLPSSPALSRESRAASDCGPLLLGIPVAASMLIWFWVSGLNLLQSPGEKVSLIILGTIIGTASAAAFEAARSKDRVSHIHKATTPTAWFFSILLLWLICYPAYLFERRKYGLRNLLIGGIIVASFFVWSAAAILVAIESRKAEVRDGFNQLQQQLESLAR